MMRCFFLSFCSCLQKIKRREDHKSVNSVLVAVPLMPNNPLNSFGSSVLMGKSHWKTANIFYSTKNMHTHILKFNIITNP